MTATPQTAVSHAHDDAAPVCGSEHCITCGDDGVPMTVMAIDTERGLALCDDGEQRWSVETALVIPVGVGDTLLVHAGTAIAMLEHLGVPG